MNDSERRKEQIIVIDPRIVTLEAFVDKDGRKKMRPLMRGPDIEP